MGNVQMVKSSNAYKTAIENLDNESYEGTDERTQSKVFSAAHHSYFTNLPNQIAEEKHVFQGSVAKDMEVEPVLRTPWMVPMNINLNISEDPLLKQKPPEVQWSVPKMVSPPISISPPFLDNVQKSLDSGIPEAADESRESNTVGKNKVAGDLMIKEAAAILPPVLGFSSGRFPNNSPLYPLEMDSISTQLSELPTMCLNGNYVTYQIQPEDRVNPTLKDPDTATSQGRSMANSNSTALEDLPNVTQPPNNVLMPLDGSQNTKQTAQAHPLFAPISETSRGHCGTELPVNTPGIKNKEAEKITHKISDTRCTTKTNPNEDRSLSIPQSSPCNVQTKTQEETQVKSNICFSYADALKRSLKVTQQSGASKHLGKHEQGLTIQQKFEGRRNTTHVVKQAITKEKPCGIVRQHIAQVNLKNPGTDSSKKITKSWNPTGPSASPFIPMKTQPRFQWLSPQIDPKDAFQFKGSRIMVKPQTFTPNTSIQFCKRKEGKDKVQHAVNFGSTWGFPKNTSTGKPLERTNPQKLGDTKKDKVYQSYPIKRRSKPKPVCNMSPTITLKQPVQSKAVVSIQPQDVGLQNPVSTPLEKPSRENNTSADDILEHPVHTEKSEQMGNGETPEPMPEVKPQLMVQSEITEDKETSAKEHDDTSDLSNSCPSVPHIKEIPECPDSNDQNSDKSLVVLENETASDPMTSVEAPDNNVSVEKDDLDKAPKHQPSGRWKDFYVDKTCTMKCRCRHRPGKLPPNVVSWFSVSQNKLAEPVWITTLTVASSLVTGTKLLLDYHSSHAPETSSSAPNE